jgi:catechol 2,3-dioxygenase-like lactoylglutathione lyase family enzyme
MITDSHNPSGAISSFHHLKIDVGDLDVALRFYCEILGFKQIVRYDRDDGVTIVQISPDGHPPGIELWEEDGHAGIRNDRLHFAFLVENVTSLLEHFERAGVEIETRPFKIGHEIIAFIRDPDGYLIELNEYHNPNPSNLKGN